MRIDTSSVRKILVIKPRAIGDVVLSTAVLKNLRLAFPRARIDFLTEYANREVVAGNPHVDDVILFHAKRDNGFGLILKIRRRRYDLVFDLFGNPRSAIVTFFSRASHRVGYRFGWRRYCYNVVLEPRGGEVHNVEFNLDAVRGIGVTPASARIEFPLDSDSEEFAEDFFSREGLAGSFVVALNPGGGWYTKRWRIPQFAALADILVAEFGVKVLLVWGPGEENDVEELQSKMSRPSLSLPQTSLKQLGAVLKRCDLFVTNDSGPMHIAAAVGVPVVALFGPTNPHLQGPVGSSHEVVRNERLFCLGCNLTDCPIGNPCMVDLGVDEVVEGIRRALSKNKLTTPTLVTA